MLKRFCILVLVPLYLITASGFAISMHYCGRLLTGVEINAPAKSCVKLVKLKCCKDKQISVKIKDSHQSAAFTFKAAHSFTIHLPKQFFTHPFGAAIDFVSAIHSNKAPPDLACSSTPIFIQNGTFRI